MALNTSHAGRGYSFDASAEDETVEQIGHATQQEDHQQTRWQSIKRNPKNFLWALYVTWSAIAISFDQQAGNVVLGIPQFRKDFGRPYAGNYVLNASWQAAFAGGPSAAGVIGSLVAGWLADRFGRKWTLLAALAITMAGVALEFVAATVQVFFCGKFVVGFATGWLNVTAITLLAEIPTLALRGLMSGSIIIAYSIGPLVAVVISNTTVFYPSRWAYRAIFAAQWGFGAVSLIIGIFMPESPWWLTMRGDDNAAIHSLMRLGHTDQSAQNHLAVQKTTIAAMAEEVKGSSFQDCFRGTNLRRTIITTMPLSVQPFIGSAFIGGYGTYYFQLAGLSLKASFQITCGTLALSMAGSIVSMASYDRFGRRLFMVWGLIMPTACLLTAGGLGTATQNHSAVLGVVAMICLWNFFAQLALGSVALAVVGETSTPRLRLKTIAVASNVQNALYTMWQFVLPYLFNPDRANLGAKTAFIFGGFAVLVWVYMFFYQPETANRSFEEIDEMFVKKVPAREFVSYCTYAQRASEAACSTKVEVVNDSVHVESKS